MSRMPRQLRPYLPAGFFHVTARTHGGHAWFDPPIRDFICDSIAGVQRRSDLKLVAFVVMPNHIHLVVQQGDRHLSWFMQPLLTRIAMAVRKKYELVGHVFGQRYWSHPCLSLDYLQTCVEYVHRNPVKAELCTGACDYPWSSAGVYNGGRPPAGLAIEPLTFAQPTSTETSRASSNLRASPTPPRNIDHVIQSALREFDCEIDLDQLRIMRGRVAAMIRNRCMQRAVEAGYRNHQIARFLCVSDAVVSRVAVAVRGNMAVRVLQPECENGSKIEDEKQTPKKIGQPKLPYSRG